MPGKFTREAKFWGFDDITKIRLYANQGKNGYNLGTTMKAPNERATTGMQTTYQTEEEANREFDRRVADTKEKGYQIRGSGTGMIGRRSRFSELPTEPEWTGAKGTPAADRGQSLELQSAPDEIPVVVAAEPIPDSDPQTVSPEPSTVEEVEQMVTSSTTSERGSKASRRSGSR